MRAASVCQVNMDGFCIDQIVLAAQDHWRMIYRVKLFAEC